MIPPVRGACSSGSLRNPATLGALPPNPRSFSLWANGPSPGRLVPWRGICRTTTRGIGPFGEARRSGCPPAEPYPAGDEPCFMITHPIPEISAAMLDQTGQKTPPQHISSLPTTPSIHQKTPIRSGAL